MITYQTNSYKPNVLCNFCYDSQFQKENTFSKDNSISNINLSYYESGRLKEVSRRADAQYDAEPVARYSYDSKGNVAQISSVDAKGRAVQTTYIGYNDSKQPTRIDNGQTITAINYNSYGYPISITNVFDQIQQRDFDQYNRLTQVIDIYGVKTLYSYNDFGAVSKIERRDDDTLLNSLAITYNANGQPISYTDQSGRVKRFERNEFGQEVKEFFPDDTSVEYAYNKLGQLDSVLDQNKHKIRFDWSKFGLDKKITAANQLTDMSMTNTEY